MSAIKNILISVIQIGFVLIVIPVVLRAQQCPPPIDTQAYSTCEGRLQTRSSESGGQFYFEMIDSWEGGIDFSWYNATDNCIFVTNGAQLNVPANGKTYLCVASVTGNVCNYFYFNAVPTPPPPAPQSNNPHVQNCSAGSSTLEIINGGGFYTWKEGGITLNSGGNGYLASGHAYVLNSGGTSLLIYHGDGPLSFNFSVTNGNSSPLSMSLTVLHPPTVAVAIAGAVSTACAGSESEFKIADPREINSYSWSLLPSNAGSISSSGIVTWAPSGFAGNATVKLNATSTLCNGFQMADEVTVLVHPSPVTPNQVDLQYCDFEDISLVIPDWPNSFNWYDNEDNFLKSGFEFTVPSKPEGNYSYQAEYINDLGCVSAYKFPINVVVMACGNEHLNYIESISYDVGAPNENQPKIAHGISYFDYSGSLLQSQVKSFAKSSVLASQTLNDKQGRSVLTTLPAPTLKSNFQYVHRFVRNSSSSEMYSSDDFDSPTTIMNPAEVGDDVPGTLGWYYSENNSVEKHVPTTDYPYSRTEFYQDGTGELKRSASAGNMHRLGMGHEVLSGTFPVYNELDDYLNKRRSTFGLGDNLPTASLMKRGVQSVVRDQNGNYTISISDQSGKTVMSARKGTLGDNVLSIPITITSNLSVGDDNFRPITYFYILESQAVTISSGNYVIENIVSGEVIATPQGNAWNAAAGFYRLILSNGSVTLSFANSYLDVSYQFYDDAGRLKSSLSPNGFKQLKDNTTASYSDVDQTSYTYNYQGWLLSMKEPDAGVTSYKYRKDGKIRFSQNAEQSDQTKNDFSYTQYDDLGRPEESGEYVGAQFSFGSLNGQSVYNFPRSDTKDWVKTYYDEPYLASRGTNIPNLPTQAGGIPHPDFAQGFTRGAVSWTENPNIQTWYSYDELGRVTWMAQKPKALNRTFVTLYTYDFLGNVLMVKNSSYVNGTSSEEFFHHYTYDLDKRLYQAFTSTDGTNKKLRATYEYYLHGPLKRIELGDQLQGIDFVYNIHGWLTQINHPDQNLDPGQDGGAQNPNVRPDVFGMVLDYYESSMNNLYSASISSGIQHLNQLHGLPNLQPSESYASHQPLIRFHSIQDPSQVISTPSKLKEFSADNPRYKQMLSQD